MSTQADPGWTAADERAVDFIRVLAMDAAQIRARVPMADYRKPYQEFGITAERVTAVARESLARARG